MAKKEKYYKVTLKKSGHRLGYTTNKYAFQRNSGWQMKDLKFTVMYKKK